MSEQRPNVVLIFMDDMTHWSLLSKEVHTPNLDRLRESGVTYTHAFVQGSMNPAVCLPARQMLLSGLTLFEADRNFMGVEHLGATLSGAGYDTYFTGKWHNEPEALEGDYNTVGPWGGGMLGSIVHSDDAYGRPAPENAWNPADTTRGGHWMTLPDGSVQHSSERWTDAAVDFLASDHAQRPYFLHLAYHAPHDPRQAPQEFLDMYPADAVRIPENFMTEHPFDNGELDVRDEYLAPIPRTHEAVQLHRREYFAMLTHVDREIGRVLDAATAADNGHGTIIVFSGDHGLGLGEHALFGKQNPYEHSIRVPLVVAAPGLDGGSERDDLVYAGSIYPTVCALAGIEAPAHIQFPVLPVGAPAPSEQQRIFNAYRDIQRVMRGTRFKLIRYSDPAHDQLFDLEQDPWELTNLIDQTEYADILAELNEHLTAAQTELGDPLVAVS